MDNKVAVIGGGIIGAVIADRLATKGLHVSLFESAPALGRGTTAACEGGILLHTQGFFYPQLQGLITESVEGWGELKQRFPDLFLTKAFLRVAYNNDDMANVKALANHAEKTTETKILSGEEIYQLEPLIAQHAMGAVLAYDEGSIDTSGFVKAMQSSLAASENVSLNFNSNVKFVRENNKGRTELAFVDNSKKEFDYVVIAAGPHASQSLLGKPLVDDQSLTHGVSAFLLGEFNISHHILTLNGPDESGLSYIVPCDGGIKVGATKIEGDLPLELNFEQHLSVIKKAAIGLCPETQSAFENAVISQGLRDMRDPYCKKIEGTNIITLGGIGGAGTTVSTGMATRVLKLIK